MKILEVKPIGMSEAKKIMDKYKDRKDLTYEQKIALEYLRKFTKLDYDKSKKLLEEVSGVLRMSPETAIQILNILPKTPDEVRLLFAKERFSLKEEEIKKILEIVKKYS
jgi:DNA-directed RNA polymerase subunit F